MHRSLACLFLLLGSACSSDPEPLALSERLPANRARAGVVTKEAELIGGPTATGDIGDIKLYNSRVAVIIEKPGPSDGYGLYGGHVIDADVIRAPGEAGRSRFGEALPVYNMRTPRGLSFEVVEDGAEGGPAIVRVKYENARFPLGESLLGTSEDGARLEVSVDYVLAPDSDELRMVATLGAPKDELIRLGHHYFGFVMGDGLLKFIPGQGFALSDVPGAGDYFAVVGEDVSYSFITREGELTPLVSFEGFLLAGLPSLFLPAGKTATWETSLIVGDGDLARHERAHRLSRLAADIEVPEVSTVTGAVKDTDGKPFAGARVHVRDSKGAYRMRTKTDSAGRFSAELEPGSYVFSAMADGRDLGSDVSVTLPSAAPVELSLAPVGRLVVSATESGAPVPVKLQARRTEGFTPVPSSFGESQGALGYERVEFLLPAEQTLLLPPGEWAVVLSRGSEYEVVEKTLSIVAGESARIDAVMERSVDSKDWVCGDFHIHSQFSADSDDLVEHKLRAIAAEGVEVPVSTEHEHIGDFAPYVKKLGYEKWMKTVIGSEVSSTQLGHFNAFPLVRDASKPNFGAVDWYGLTGSQMVNAMRSNPGKPFVQTNHPRSGSFGSPFIKGFFSAVGFDPETFTVKAPENWTTDFDGIEIANGGRPDYEDWFAFLDRGLRKVATSGSDTHIAIADNVGYPRTCVRVGVDDPLALEEEVFMRALREGRALVSGGFQVEIGVGDKLIGDVVEASRASGALLPVQVKVQAPTWITGASRLEIVVDGTVVETRTLEESSQEAVRFAETVSVPVPEGRDAWIIARVVSEARLGPVTPGAWAFGFTNPVFFDGDSDGKFSGRLSMP